MKLGPSEVELAHKPPVSTDLHHWLRGEFDVIGLR